VPLIVSARSFKCQTRNRDTKNFWNEGTHLLEVDTLRHNKIQALFLPEHMRILTFPHAFAPVHMSMLFPDVLPSDTRSSSKSLMSGYGSIPAPPRKTSFGTNVSTVCSCNGCLWKSGSGQNNKISERSVAPALLNINHIFIAHLRSSIIVQARGFRKAEQAIELSTNVACIANRFCIWKDTLRELLYYFELPVFHLL